MPNDDNEACPYCGGEGEYEVDGGRTGQPGYRPCQYCAKGQAIIKRLEDAYERHMDDLCERHMDKVRGL